jgi:cellulose 1,4-beta-cellobiosidase
MTLPMRQSNRRRPLAYALIGAVVAAGLVAVPASVAHAAVACEVTYARTWDNGSGFGAAITIRNVGDPLAGWRLTFTWPGSQRITQGWSATWSQTGRDVTATNAAWNGSVPTNGSVSVGFNGTYTGTNTNPTVFAVNGVTCNGPQQPVAVVVTPAAVTVPERGTAVAAVRLSRRPSASVTLTGTPGVGDASLTLCGGLPMTFTPDNWDVAQTLTFCAAADADTTNGTRTFSIGGPGVTAAAVTATELDRPAIDPIILPTQVQVPEGGSATISIRLSAPPTTNVTITVTAGGGGDPDLTLCGGSTLTFTPANWNIAQNITICAAEDPDTINGTRTFVFGSVGMTSVTVTATEVDNDVSKVDNPYAGADGYVNADWSGLVNAEAANHSAPLADQMRAVGAQPTALWLDRIAAITAGRGLAGHLDAALAQDAANGTRPVVVTLVLFDLPNRHCPAPGGELTVTGNGLLRYRAEFIDPIREILARPAYANLRVAVIVEPGSLHTMVTHSSPRPIVPLRCVEAQASGVYREGIRYAVGQLATAANAYLYLDISNSGWLGWPDNFNPTVALYDQTIASASGGPGYDKIHGFAVNTAGYVPTEEVFLPDPFATRGGSQLLLSRFFDFNPRFDERDFATDLRAAFADRGCTACGLLIDTSRNGWGGPARPTAPGTSQDLNTYVNASRIDRRPHRSGYCNQNGAGLGVRPTAETGVAGVDAFVWAKPPGESDGVSQPNILDEDDPFRAYDQMCDPTRANIYEDEVTTNALANAPHFGRWFPQQFEMLVRNAYPPIS